MEHEKPEPTRDEELGGEKPESVKDKKDWWKFMKVRQKNPNDWHALSNEFQT